MFGEDKAKQTARPIATAWEKKLYCHEVTCNHHYTMLLLIMGFKDK